MKPSQRITWSNSLLFLLAQIWFIPNSVLPDDGLQALGLSGSFRASFFSNDKLFDNKKGFGVGALWMTARPREFMGLRTFIDARVQGQISYFTRNKDFSWELREGYADYSLSGFDVRAGRQILIWGRADKFNPTDVWSSRDYTLLASEDEDQRLGILTLRLGYAIENFHITALWQPEWRQPVFPLRPRPGLTIQNLKPLYSENQFGIKIDRSGGTLDWSISYANSIDRIPDLSILSSGNQGLLIGLRYHKIQMFGTDAAFTFGEYGVRAEMAYTVTHDNDGMDPLTKNSNLFTVIGIDRTFGGVFNINGQYLDRIVFDHQKLTTNSDVYIRNLAEQVNITSNQLDQHMHGASLRISHRALNDTFESEIAGAIWLNKNDILIRPKISYAVSDVCKTSLGGELYFGPEDSFFGQLKDTKTIFIEMRLGF